VIKTISYDQHEILAHIVNLHTGPVDCDVTYGRGGFYKKLPAPALRFDLDPPAPGIVPADARCLPLPGASVGCVAFDPPFMLRTGEGARLKRRFGAVVGGMPDLWEFYRQVLAELGRILRPGGHVIFKCQDGVLSGKNHFTHCEIYNMAMHLGFIPVDLFVLLARHRMDPRGRRQVHARKFHSYFWVLRKEGA